MSMEKLGAFVGGALFATVGAKILASKDAQKVYVYTTAAALREKDDVMAVTFWPVPRRSMKSARPNRPRSLRIRRRRLSKYEMHNPA